MALDKVLPAESPVAARTLLEIWRFFKDDKKASGNTSLYYYPTGCNCLRNYRMMT